MQSASEEGEGAPVVRSVSARCRIGGILTACSTMRSLETPKGGPGAPEERRELQLGLGAQAVGPERASRLHHAQRRRAANPDAVVRTAYGTADAACGVRSGLSRGGRQ